jgi:hypothetical protein
MKRKLFNLKYMQSTNSKACQEFSAWAITWDLPKYAHAWGYAKWKVFVEECGAPRSVYEALHYSHVHWQSTVCALGGSVRDEQRELDGVIERAMLPY